MLNLSKPSKDTQKIVRARRVHNFLLLIRDGHVRCSNAYSCDANFCGVFVDAFVDPIGPAIVGKDDPVSVAVGEGESGFHREIVHACVCVRGGGGLWTTFSLGFACRATGCCV